MQAIRNSYKVILAKYEKINKGNVRLTQSSLLLLQNIDATKSSYTFPILETDQAANIQPEEIRLNMNDEFVSYDVSFYLVADVAVNLTPFTPVSKFYLPYAPMELDVTFAALARAWDSVLNIDVNKISRILNWDLKKHNIIPETQFKGVSTGLPYATIPNIDYSENGTFQMQPMLTLSGAKKSNIMLVLNNGAIPATAAGVMIVPDATEEEGAELLVTANRLALFFRGMLAQNASSFQ